MRIREKMKHAFAVDPPGPAEPTAEQQRVVDWVCRQVAMRHLTTPALIALEMARPLNWIAAQGMHVFAPIIWAIAREQTHEDFNHFAAYIEQRGSIEYLCRRIEHLEHEYKQQDRVTAPRAAVHGEAAPEENDDFKQQRGIPRDDDEDDRS